MDRRRKITDEQVRTLVKFMLEHPSFTLSRVTEAFPNKDDGFPLDQKYLRNLVFTSERLARLISPEVGQQVRENFKDARKAELLEERKKTARYKRREETANLKSFSPLAQRLSIQAYNRRRELKKEHEKAWEEED
jgi:hypothetical protein